MPSRDSSGVYSCCRFANDAEFCQCLEGLLRKIPAASVSRSCWPRLNYELLPLNIWEEKESAAFDTLDSVIMTPHADFSHLPRTGFSPPRLRIESPGLYKHYYSCSLFLSPIIIPFLILPEGVKHFAWKKEWKKWNVWILISKNSTECKIEAFLMVLRNIFAFHNVLEFTWIIRVSLCVADLADTSMFRQEGVTTYSQLLFDVARQQVVVGARYVFSRRKLVFNYRVNPLVSRTTVAVC